MPGGRPRAFWKPRPSGESTTSSSSEDESLLRRPVTPPSTAGIGTAHSPRKGSRLAFLFGRKPLGGSDADDSDREAGTRMHPVKRLPANGWVHHGTVPTHSVWKVLDKLKNDYINPQYTQDSNVRVVYSNHPGDRARDIRARPCIVEWTTPDRNAPKSYTKHPRPVFRVSYFCKGNHDAGSPPADGDSKSVPGDDDDCNCDDREEENHECKKVDSDDEGSQADSRADSSRRGRSSKRDRCPQRAKVVVEVLSDKLAEANVWIQHGDDHPPCRSKYQVMSQFVRQGIYECAQLGMTAGKIKQRLMHVYKKFKIPKRRRPEGKQVQAIVQEKRNKGRLNADPIKAIGVFAEEHPEKIFNFEIHDPDASPPKKFSTGVTDDFALESLLLYGDKNGAALDSSFRHKNEQRAPLTFFATINDAEHLVPGTAYLSEDVQEKTLVEFLEATRARVIERAQAIVQDPSCMKHEKSLHPTLLAKAQAVVNKGTWEPAWVMIDKTLAEVNALRRVWPKLTVRLCQFHVIQAILRWERDVRLPRDEHEQSRLRLSIGIKRRILWAFRELQRCSSADQWDTYRTRFEQRLADIFEGTGAGQLAAVLGYFRANWFTETWRDLWTDIGIPHGSNRVGMLNTNNWVERAFKTFDTLFLDFRTNKRLDRLVIILANEFFPFYEEWEPDQPRLTKKIAYDIETAHMIWSTPGMIEEIEDDRWEVSETRPKKTVEKSSGDSDTDMDSDFSDTDSTKKQEAYFVIVQREESGRLVCQCPSHTQTGRPCVHIRAVTLFLGNGDVQKYIDNETVRATTGQASRGIQKSSQRTLSEGYQALDRLVDKERDLVLEDVFTSRTYERNMKGGKDEVVDLDLDDESMTHDRRKEVKRDIALQFGIWRITSTFFWQKVISSRSEDRQKLFKWYQGDVNLFDLAKLIVPIHFEKKPEHWALGCVSFKRATLEYYDSYRTGVKARSEVFFFGMKSFLMEYALAHKLEASQIGEWATERPSNIPRQSDSTSCGLYAAFAMEELSHGRSILGLTDIPDGGPSALRKRYLDRLVAIGVMPAQTRSRTPKPENHNDPPQNVAPQSNRLSAVPEEPEMGNTAQDNVSDKKAVRHSHSTSLPDNPRPLKRQRQSARLNKDPPPP